jgi:ribosomal protein S27AE
MPLLTHSQEPPARSERERADTIRFCSRCGGPDDALPGRPELRRRVCERCGMGVMLTSQSDALPAGAAAFMVVTAELAVSAVSRRGDKVFGEEGELIGSHLLSLVSSPLGDDQLEHHVRRAAQSRCDTVALPVRLVPEDAPRVGTLSARIASCSSPPAALIAVEPSRFGIR